MSQYTSQWEWIHECIGLFGEDILATSKELDISFSDAIALYSFVLQLSSADFEQIHREKMKNDL